MKTNYNSAHKLQIPNWNIQLHLKALLLIVSITLLAIADVKAQTYCAAGGSVSFGEKIANVTFNTINNNSTSTGGYEDFTSISTNVSRSGSYDLTIALSSAYNQDQVIAFIDYNHDGDFTDTGELVYTSPVGTGPYNANITIPSTAVLGAARMRIRMHDTSYQPNSSSCGNTYYGQVEDYTINVSNAPFYCAAGSTDPYLEKISNVTFNNINNSSTSIAGYEDFTNIVGNAAPGAIYQFTANISQGYYTDQLLVWIDYNQNGSFNDPGEDVYTSAQSAGPFSTYIQIPTNSPTGLVRMRVRLTSNLNSTVNTTSCGTSFFGQVEDYTLNVNCIPVSWFIDADNDGFGDPATEIVQCETFGGYVLNGLDCNDASATYADADGDGFGVGPKIPCGTAMNNFDCNDSVIYYWDADQDGYGAGNPVSCGYVSTNTDCNDSDYYINAGATENLTNGIDDNCNGQIDENPFAPYCQGTAAGVQPITLVNFAGINNTSAANSSSVHENFISITGNVTQNESYPMTLKAKTFSDWTDYLVVWIDWDQNGIFNTTNEKYIAGTITGSTGLDAVTAVSTIAVPLGALTGTTRMRVQLNQFYNPYNPCVTDSSGQFEDYSLNVLPCTGSQWYADADNDGFGDIT
ncbi:MAG TPA: GEVED domain-containing protein, partial [Flavobacterium sp.]